MSYNNSDRRAVKVVHTPAHPVQQLQGPFEESMFESQSEPSDEIEIPLDASARRNMLLEAPTYQRVIAGRWKQKSGERYHPLWKLIAQMSFGIHLLAEGMAKSEEDVFQILQTHVDDIDVFLERTTEDFTLAQEDIQERLTCLRLPLQHPEVFERMLEDRTFRNSIVEGNEKIEHIVTRTGAAMKDALKDVQKGFDSTSTLERYFQDLEVNWIRSTPEHDAVFFAMCGNVEGWKRAFVDLHMQGNKLAGSLKKLTDVINEMQTRAGEVSRRLVKQQQERGGVSNGSSNITYVSQRQGSHQLGSTERDGRISSTTRKPYPNPPFRTSTRQHPRNEMREPSYQPRSTSSQTRRPEAAQGGNLVNPRLEAPYAGSGNGTSSPIPNLSTRMNIGTPRIVSVKSQTPEHRPTSHAVYVRQYVESAQSTGAESATPRIPRTEDSKFSMTRVIKRVESNDSYKEMIVAPRQTVKRTFAPVELPAEMLASASLQAPVSNTNRMRADFGVSSTVYRTQAQSKAFNSTNALIGLLNDTANKSKSPLVPTPDGPDKAALAVLHGRERQPIKTQQATRTPLLSGRPSGDELKGYSESPPNTPAWATPTFDQAERSRVVAGKIAFRSHPPDHVSQNPQTESVTPKVPTIQQTRTQGSSHSSIGGSSIGEPGPVISGTDFMASELSAGYEDDIARLSNLRETDVTTKPRAPDVAPVPRKTFVAELEGTAPVYLPSTVYTPSVATRSPPTNIHELEAPQIHFTLPPRPTTDSALPSTYELEAPQIHFRLPPRPTAPRQDSASVSEPSIDDRVRSNTDSKDEVSVSDESRSIPLRLEPAVYSSYQTSDGIKQDKSAQETTPRLDSARYLSHLEDDKIRPFDSSSSPGTERVHSSPTVTIRSRGPTTVDVEIEEKSPFSPTLGCYVHKLPLTSESKAPKSISPLHTSTAYTLDNDPEQQPPESPPMAKSTSERPKSPFPFLNQPQTPTDANIPDANSSPTATIDLQRSNTKDSRTQWRAFFKGQLKNSSPSSTKSSRTTSSRVDGTNVTTTTGAAADTTVHQSVTESPRIQIRPPTIEMNAEHLPSIDLEGAFAGISVSPIEAASEGGKSVRID